MLSELQCKYQVHAKVPSIINSQIKSRALSTDGPISILEFNMAV